MSMALIYLKIISLKVIVDSRQEWNIKTSLFKISLINTYF